MEKLIGGKQQAISDEIENLIDISEEKGWSVSVVKMCNNKRELWFQQYTDMGQDFNFSVDYDDDPKVVVKKMYDYWENFDLDEEVSLWIGPDGHGKNGAPYHISDILKDMKQAEDMMEELWKTLWVVFC